MVLIVGSEAVYVGEAALTVSLEVELTVPLGPTEEEQDALSVGEHDVLIINGAQVRLNVPSEAIAVADDSTAYLVRALVVELEGLAVAEGQARRHGVELLVQPDGSIVGEPGASIVG
ncbi:MAG TPA: hypothetical protein PKE00_06935, partial [Planctomycetota bacterium]|nr:hypothetical protein [Planctomycetota bacterium]